MKFLVILDSIQWFRKYSHDSKQFLKSDGFSMFSMSCDLILMFLMKSKHCPFIYPFKQVLKFLYTHAHMILMLLFDSIVEKQIQFVTSSVHLTQCSASSYMIVWWVYKHCGWFFLASVNDSTYFCDHFQNHAWQWSTRMFMNFNNRFLAIFKKAYGTNKLSFYKLLILMVLSLVNLLCCILSYDVLSLIHI